MVYARFEQGPSLTEYKASNGKIYHIGDTIKLGRASGLSGEYKFITIAGIQKLLARPDDKRSLITQNLSDYGAVIKKINSKNVGGFDKIFFSIKVQGYPSSLDLFIEDAIATCEVADCVKTDPAKPGVQQSGDKFDQLKKLKGLLDSGAITQAEYDAQKKKLLDN